MSVRLPVFGPSAQCAPCGGKCCQTAPGNTSPEDWGAPDERVMVARLREAFATGKWAIDRAFPIEDHPIVALREPVWIVRPAVKGWENAVDPFHEMVPDDDPISRLAARLMLPERHPCAFHGPAGCALAFDARPLECRALKPREVPVGNCLLPSDQGWGTRAIEWAPYHDLLKRVVDAGW